MQWVRTAKTCLRSWFARRCARRPPRTCSRAAAPARSGPTPGRSSVTTDLCSPRLGVRTRPAPISLHGPWAQLAGSGPGRRVPNLKGTLQLEQEARVAPDAVPRRKTGPPSRPAWLRQACPLAGGRRRARRSRSSVAASAAGDTEPERPTGPKPRHRTGCFVLQGRNSSAMPLGAAPTRTRERPRNRPGGLCPALGPQTGRPPPPPPPSPPPPPPLQGGPARPSRGSRSGSARARNAALHPAPPSRRRAVPSDRESPDRPVPKAESANPIKMIRVPGASSPGPVMEHVAVMAAPGSAQPPPRRRGSRRTSPSCVRTTLLQATCRGP